MTLRLADHLSAARKRTFIGREAEREFFRSNIHATELEFYVLHVFGPGGVGKTTLLKEFITLCNQNSVNPIYLDGRNIEASPNVLLGALNLAMGLPLTAAPLEALNEAARQQRQVILIDTYELLKPIDNWLREVFLPQLPENVLVVLAGHTPPSAAWRTDPGWQNFFRTLPLRNLTPDESLSYLTNRNVPVEQQRPVLDFTHGHPLALCLVADLYAQHPDAHFQPEAAPDVVKTLLEQLVQKVPGPAHRTALEACALLRLTTEPLLAEILKMPEVHDLFDWLRGLSFIDSGLLGLFPHDLAREALSADLRWRNPDWYAELQYRARAYYGRRLPSTRGQEQQRLLFDYIFLHRNNPMVRPFLEWQTSGTLMTDSLHPQDIAQILATVELYEGPASAKVAEHWLTRQPQGVRVFRDSRQQLDGFSIMVKLHLVEAEDLAIDPVIKKALDFLASHRPLAEDETAVFFRFWMACDNYQAVSATQSLTFVTALQYYMIAPGLVYSFFPCSNPEFWSAMFSYTELARLPELDFEINGRAYGTYGHDWRAQPPMVWLAMMEEREIVSQPSARSGATKTEAPLVVLSRPEFTEAVNSGLHDYARPGGLNQNPLLRSRLVVEQVKAGAALPERIVALQTMLKNACEALQASPKEAKYYRALYHTYLQPAATQEQAAELLDVPFSSFRRHLKAGIARVEEILWQRELQGLEV